MYLQSNINFLITNKNKFCIQNNINKRTFEDIAYGKTQNPRIDIIIKIAQALNISLDDLVLKDLSKSDKE